MPAYFDLHLHPSFKPYLSHYQPEKRRDCWRSIRSLIGILRSQSSLNQLWRARVNLAVAAIYAVEQPMNSSFLIRHIAPRISFLHKRMLDHPPGGSYTEMVMDEIRHLEQHRICRDNESKSFQLLRSMDEFDPSRLNLILALEGGHTLESVEGDLTDTLQRLKAGPYRFLYLTLVHLIRYPLATHCYGMKLIRDNSDFKPAGFGLGRDGRQVIDLAYDRKKGQRILVDIKHMSLVSRYQFYEYRRQMSYEDIPIIASHMGVTGLSRSPANIADHFRRPPVRQGPIVEVQYDRPQGIGEGRSRTWFNPWSINLYDEDISEILASDGLIGLSLDQRILGSQRVQGEYFSARELNFILHDYREPPRERGWREGEFTDEIEETERALNERKHLRHFCNNLLHLIKTGGEKAWDHVCIGSDFDGLINPINNCRNVTEYPKLERQLRKMLPQMMEEDSTFTYDTSDMGGKVRRLMYDNAISFLHRHFA